MDYPDPHNEYFDTFYGKKTTGRRQAWVNDAFDKELEAGRDTRDPKKRLEHYKKAEEIMQQDVGYVPIAWVVRYAAKKPWVAGIEKNKAGEFVVDGNIYVGMLEHIYIVEKGLGHPEGASTAPSEAPPRLTGGRERFLRPGSAAGRSGCGRSASGHPDGRGRRCRGPAA